MPSVTVAELPGLRALGDEFLTRYAGMVERNGWHPNGPIGVMYRESGLRPDVQLTTTDTKTGERGPCLSLERPRDCAVGLLQWTKAGARASGLSGTRADLEAIAAMSASDQLALVEAFFQATERYIGAKIQSPEDFYLAAFGFPAAIGQSDATPLITSLKAGGDAREDRIYQVNKGLDRNADGIITAGDVRERFREGIGHAGGRTITIPLVLEGPSMGAPRRRGGLLPALVIVGVGGAIFYKTLKP